jgi:hypothetical protein
MAVPSEAAKAAPGVKTQRPTGQSGRVAAGSDTGHSTSKTDQVPVFRQFSGQVVGVETGAHGSAIGDQSPHFRV